MPDYTQRYKEEFGEVVPTMYFTDETDARDAALSAIKRGAPLTDEEWLEEAGYTEDEIEEIKEGERKI